MKIKSNKIIQYSAATILASGCYIMWQNQTTTFAAEENVVSKADQIKQLTRQLDAQKGEIKKVEIKKNKLIESLVILEEKEKNLSTLIQENTEQKKELTDVAGKIAEDKQGLSDQLSSLKEEINQKKSFIESKEKLLAKYEDDLLNSKNNPNVGLSEKEKSELEQLTKNKDSEEQKLKSTKKLKAEEMEIIQSREANIKSLEETLIELNKNPEANKDDIFNVNSQIKMAQEILTKAQKTVAARERSISRSESKIKEYQDKISSIKVKVDSNASTIDLQNKIEDMKHDIDDLNFDKNDSMSKMETISKRIDQLLVQQNSIDLISIDNKIEKLKQEHSDVLKEIEENKQSQQDIENKKAKLTSEISNLQTKIAEVEKKENLAVQKNKNDGQPIVKLPGNRKVLITISSSTADESVKVAAKKTVEINKSKKGKDPSAIKFKKGTFLLKIDKKWVKIKPKSLPKYLNNKFYKVKLTTKVKGKWGRVKLVDRKGKKTKQTIKRGKTININGVRIINKHIYMHIGKGKYISINNTKI